VPRPLLRVAFAAALAPILLAGCGADDAGDAADDPAAASGSPAAASEDDAASVPAPAASDPAEPSEPAAEVPDILRFEATTVAGDAFDGASVAGRPVVLWFWAPWCSVCASQAPEVTDLSEQYGDEVAFLGVGSLDGGEAIAGFAEDVPGPTHLSDPDGELYQRFGIAEQSSFVVLDADGREVLRTGYADDDALAGTVAELAG
jgi:thiol-disulfide isomerase/thioredoxin